MESARDESSRILREIAESCKQQQWSVAIRLLTSLPTFSSSAVLYCNRALCYGKLELHKHVIKDCDNALALSPSTLRAYLYKGQALAAMGKQQESTEVWRKGYEVGASQLTDLQLLLQLHSLVTQESDLPQKETITAETVATDISTNTGKTEPDKEHLENGGHSRVATVTDSKEGKLQDTKETSQGQVRRLSVELRLARGISEVNSGKYEKAVDIFTQLIKDDLGSAAALIGRGTAYAFQRKLDLAIADFSKAIDLDPKAIEAWKRRGQARAAVAPSHEAISDLSEALKLDAKSPETLNERGVVYYKLKDYLSAADDLRACVALDSANKYAYNYLGLALTAAGEYVDGLAAHYKALELDSSFKEAWTHLAQSYKELADSAKAMECLRRVLSLDATYIHAYRLMGLLLLSLGDHRGAIKELTIGLEMDSSNKDCHYLRGSCFHAIGNYKDAVKDYDVVVDSEVQPSERTVQSLSFYQREIALYCATRTNAPFNFFNIDDDLEPIFKEAWCKRLSPVALFPSYARQPQLKEPVLARTSKVDDLALTKAKKTLLEAADRLGQLIQYNCPGFLRNARQHRMAGLAAIEIAQRVANYLGVLREAKKVQEMSIVEKEQKPKDETMEEVSHNRGGVCSSSNTFSPPCSCHEEALLNQGLRWRDVYTIAVKWRQISEPCDPVVWVDKLSEREFAAGFGSHTPMLLGQSKIVRYYPNFQRAFGVAKKIILEERQVFNAANKPVDLSDPMQLLAIDSAATCRELYDVVGQDFWIVTPCHSTSTSGKVLDGTRLTLQKLGLNGFDFSIRTPGTPERWAQYDEEMTAAWEEYCRFYWVRSKVPNNPKQMKQLQECILRLSYYWYNFMPLARGTAVVGYVTLLGLFLAADMEVTASIPDSVQVDWEAILSPDLQTFLQSVRPWLLPSLTRDLSWQTLPNVSETFSTLGSVVGVLSSHY
ncbi:hypothetical protein R1sor_017804 [Riccia sorocarpa]|uniref:Tetratricopeptide repeat protein 13 n=1 Tax=Riccia sorocarpa TaxID=122646 RepID=A0ABD3I803_9MARC